MHKKIIIPLLTFIIWFSIPYDFSDIEKLFYQVRVCNNSDKTIFHMYINKQYRFWEIQPWKCSPYKNLGQLYKSVELDVYPIEKWNVTHYSTTPIDLFWVQKIKMWKHTLNVDKIVPTRFIKQTYRYGLKYSIN